MAVALGILREKVRILPFRNTVARVSRRIDIFEENAEPAYYP